MITRNILLVVSFLYINDISCQQNDLNNPNIGQQQGILQKSLNQIASNQGLPINLQQILNSRQCSNTQQPQKSQVPITLVEGNQNPQGQSSPKGYHQQLIVQQPQVPNLNAADYDQQTFVIGDAQLYPQKNPGMTNQLTGTPILTSQSLQFTPIASSPQMVMTFQPSFESVPSAAPQTQQIVISGVPSYVIERSQPNYVNSPVPNTAAFNDPSPMFYSGPLPNFQILDLSQSEIPNQITITKYVQPQSPIITNTNQQPMTGTPMMSSKTSYPMVPLLGSNAIPSSNQPSKSSSLKSLLPLILNILKERDNCDCCQNCGYKNKNQQKGEINGKDKGNGFKSSKPSDTPVDSSDRNEKEFKVNSIKPGPKKVVKEDSYEDYEDDDDSMYND